MKKATKVWTLLSILPILLTSCAKPIDSISQDGITIAAPNSEESDPAASNSLQLTSPPTTEGGYMDEYNLQTVKREDGRYVDFSVQVDETYTLDVNAFVDVSDVQLVGLYEYHRTKITDEQRENLLDAYFGDRIDQVECKESLSGKKRWELKTETEYCYYAESYDPHFGEDTFFIENYHISHNELDEYMKTSFDNICMDLKLQDAYDMCASLILSLEGDTEFIPDNVRPFHQNAETENDYYWIVYRRLIDGIPVTSENDLKFYVFDDGSIDLHEALYDFTPIPLESTIISLDEAINCIQSNASLINAGSGFMSFEGIFDHSISVSEISFEYIVDQDMNQNAQIVPIWRFQIGTDGEQRLIYRDRIPSINIVLYITHTSVKLDFIGLIILRLISLENR